MTKRNVMIRIHTVRTGISAALFEGAGEELEEEIDEEEELPAIPSAPNGDGEESTEEDTEMLMEGALLTSPTRVELVYEETELTGMEGSVSTIGFDRASPGLVTMLRSGLVSTALVFEAGRRHTCVYNTPFSSFDVCVVTKKVNNDLLRSGVLELDYLIELHGAQAERCRITVNVIHE